MQRIVVHTNEEGKEEFFGTTVPQNVSFVASFDEFLQSSADVFIDLLFTKEPLKTEALKKLKGLVIINSVVDTLQEMQAPFVRINAWPGCSYHLIEASCLNESLQQTVEKKFESFGKTVQWLPDEPGFVTPRVISMIINEAYYALGEAVSSKEEIDTAMKLGTAYPYGPFEWAAKIGLQNILALLTRLSKEKQQYEPAPLLLQEALVARY